MERQSRHDELSMDSYAYLREFHLDGKSARLFDQHECYGPVLDLLNDDRYHDAIEALRDAGFSTYNGVYYKMRSHRRERLT